MRQKFFENLIFPNEQFTETGYVGAKHYDAKLLAEFLSAYHGLLPWNVMIDPNYYDGLLRSGIKRPTTAVVLDEQARMKYRQEKFSGDA